jgi:RNA recognition motif-containing protein
MGMARTLFVRGLPYHYDRANIRKLFEQFGEVQSMVMEKQMKGRATIEYKAALSASTAIVKLDKQKLGRAKLMVQCAKLFSAPKDEGGDGEIIQEEEPDEEEQMECPISFSGRGTKSDDRTSKLSEQRWKSADGMVWCEICGRRGHFSQGCPLTLRSYHQQVWHTIYPRQSSSSPISPISFFPFPILRRLHRGLSHRVWSLTWLPTSCPRRVPLWTMHRRPPRQWRWEEEWTMQIVRWKKVMKEEMKALEEWGVRE